MACVVTTIVGCSSDVYPARDIRFEGSSHQAAVEHVYFSTPAGTGCAGVRIRSEGTRRVLSFVRAAPDAEVDAVTAASADPTWEGMFRVEVPIDEAVLRDGGEMSLEIEGGGGPRTIGTYTYPPAARSEPASRRETETPRR